MIAVGILAPVAERGLGQGEWRGVITVKLWRIETQNGACLLVFHDVMVSTFKFGGNRRFFGVDTADFVWCRGVGGPSDFLSYATSLSQTLQDDLPPVLRQ